MCEETNLPSHESESTAKSWMEKFAPGVTVTGIFQCGDHWHVQAIARAPSTEHKRKTNKTTKKHGK